MQTNGLVRASLAAAIALATSVTMTACTAASPEPAAPSASSGLPSAAPIPSDNPTGQASASASPAAPSSAPSSSRSQTSFGILEAIAVAQRAEDGDVTGAELTRFGEASAWQVDIRRSRTVTVEITVSGSGRVQDQRNDDTDDEARTVPDSPATDAITSAEKRIQGQATSVELDSDDGRRVWQVKISRPGDQAVDVTYDADSGAYVRQEIDN